MNRIVKLYHNGEEYYIDEYQEGWKPGIDTIIYLPLESDVLDKSGNGYNGTVTGTAITYGKIGGSTVNSGLLKGTRITTSLTNIPKTINFWIYKPTDVGDPSINDWKQLLGFNSSDSGNGLRIRGNYMNGSSQANLVLQTTNSDFNQKVYGAILTNKRLNICVTSDGSTKQMYVNGQVFISVSGGFSTASTGMWIGTSPYDGISSHYNSYSYFSKIIGENKVRTAQEITDYYNQTKNLYGIN